VVGEAVVVGEEVVVGAAVVVGIAVVVALGLGVVARGSRGRMGKTKSGGAGYIISAEISALKFVLPVGSTVNLLVPSPMSRSDNLILYPDEVPCVSYIKQVS
jgi:hypothetical protein